MIKATKVIEINDIEVVVYLTEENKVEVVKTEQLLSTMDYLKGSRSFDTTSEHIAVIKALLGSLEVQG